MVTESYRKTGAWVMKNSGPVSPQRKRFLFSKPKWVDCMRDYKQTSDTTLSQTETKMQSDNCRFISHPKKRLYNARSKKQKNKINIHSFSRFGFGLFFFFFSITRKRKKIKNQFPWVNRWSEFCKVDKLWHYLHDSGNVGFWRAQVDNMRSAPTYNAFVSD